MSLSLTPSAVIRQLAAVGLACLALSSATGVCAGVVVSTYTYGYDADSLPPPNLYKFNSSPFGFTPDAVPVAGVYSSASAIDNRRSRLPGADGAPVFEDISNTSGVRSSTTAGQTVVADASLQALPAPLLGPAAARSMSSLLENHASASTRHQLSAWNSTPVFSGGQTYEPNYFYIERRRTAMAQSAWFETWTASEQKPVDITLALDGHLGFDRFCSPSADCGVALPAGVDSVRSDPPYVSLAARFSVVDLDELIICDDPDECGAEGVGHPLPLNILTARYHGDDGLPFDYLGQWTLSFKTTVGHRYLVMGSVSVEAQNGGEIDFFNTMRVTNIQVDRGVLRSDATGLDLADRFVQGPGVVPVPATGWLLLAGGGAAVFCRRRARRD